MSEPRCETCDHWLVRRVTTYDTGETIVGYQAPDGQGHCDVFDRDFKAAFFCAEHKPSGWDHVEKKHKHGTPWQHFTMGPCPDCAGVGHSVGCKRCVGTGKVRYYDDGHIGEEYTRLHPKEKEQIAKGPPKCHGCGKDVDINWVACPWCGVKTHEPPSELEVIGFDAQGQGTTDEMIRAAQVRRGKQEAVQSGQQFNPPPQEGA